MNSSKEFADHLIDLISEWIVEKSKEKNFFDEVIILSKNCVDVKLLHISTNAAVPITLKAKIIFKVATADEILEIPYVVSASFGITGTFHTFNHCKDVAFSRNLRYSPSQFLSVKNYLEEVYPDLKEKMAEIIKTELIHPND